MFKEFAQTAHAQFRQEFLADASYYWILTRLRRMRMWVRQPCLFLLYAESRLLRHNDRHGLKHWFSPQFVARQNRASPVVTGSASGMLPVVIHQGTAASEASEKPGVPANAICEKESPHLIDTLKPKAGSPSTDKVSTAFTAIQLAPSPEAFGALCKAQAVKARLKALMKIG